MESMGLLSRLAFALALLTAVPAWAADLLAPTPVAHFQNTNGTACSGCKLFTYSAGTNTKLATYTNSGGGTANVNPIILNSRGEANIWIASGTAYKFTLSPSTDSDPPSNSIWTVDQISNPALGTMASQNANAVAITGGTIAGVTFSTATITAPTVTGGTFTGGSFFPTMTTKTTDYTVATGDCSSTLLLNGAAQFTLTFPIATVTAHCRVDVIDGDSRGKLIGGTLYAGSFWMWPGQVCRFYEQSGAWNSDCPKRYNPATAVTLYVSCGGGLDTNDGLTSGSALLHVNTAISKFQSLIDNTANTPIIQVADGTCTEAVVMTGFAPGGASGITIQGNPDPAKPTTVVLTGPAVSNAVVASDGAILTLKNLKLVCDGTGDNGIVSKLRATVYLTGTITTGGCASGIPFYAYDGGLINVASTVTLAGNSATLFYANGAGSVILLGAGPYNCSIALNTGIYAAVSSLGQIDTNLINPTFQNAGNCSGKIYQAVLNGAITSNGTVFPGGVAGTTATGGLYN
jgi:hypothetical protein